MRTMTETPFQGDDELAQALRTRATWLSYMAFAVCVQRVLAAEGYEELRSFGRLSFRGGSSLGGADLEGLAPLPFGKAATLIQLKRYARTVPRRFVDELRGTMMRYQVPQGVLVTTATFSRRARLAASLYPGRPVRLIDGTELGHLMLRARIGVSEETDIDSGVSRLSLNERAFQDLEEFCERIRRAGGPAQFTS